MKLDLALRGPVGTEEIDVSRLPATVERTGSKFFGIFMVVFALVWGGFPLGGFMATWPQALDDPAMALMLLFPLIGVGLLLFGLRQIVWRQAVTIDDIFVSVAERGLFGETEWREQRSAYRGVLSRTRQVRRKNSTTTYYLVDLLHPDAKKTVNLSTSTDRRAWRGKWESYARRLDLPALEDGDGGLIARDAGDLDTSAGELARDGKIAFADVDLAAPPVGLAVERRADALVITRSGPQNSLPGALVAVLFPLVFVYVGFFLDDVPWPVGLLFGTLGLIFEAVVLAGMAWDLLSRRRLRVGPEAARVTTVSRWGETRGRGLPLAAVEGVKVAKVSGQWQASLVISGDRESLKFGAGLPADSLDFLRNAVLARLASPAGGT